MDNEKFGKFISGLRKANNLTQKELAKILNVTDKAVSKWERGKSFPDISLLEPLSMALNISLVELLKCEKTKKKENEDLILEAINLYKKEIKRKRKHLFIAIFIILLIISGTILLIWEIKKKIYKNTFIFFLILF